MATLMRTDATTARGALPLRSFAFTRVYAGGLFGSHLDVWLDRREPHDLVLVRVEVILERRGVVTHDVEHVRVPVHLVGPLQRREGVGLARVAHAVRAERRHDPRQLVEFGDDVVELRGRLVDQRGELEKDRVLDGGRVELLDGLHELGVEHDDALDVRAHAAKPVLFVLVAVEVALEARGITGEHEQTVGEVVRLVRPLNHGEEVRHARGALDLLAVGIELSPDAVERVELLRDDALEAGVPFGVNLGELEKHRVLHRVPANGGGDGGGSGDRGGHGDGGGRRSSWDRMLLSRPPPRATRSRGGGDW
mmetsp:Transcript_23095/g.61551  ORF Transcript_23095/g.61551 Transcript_23095/m.61551 type:complete len:308 (-) Transcript_23095:993-1916(-)